MNGGSQATRASILAAAGYSNQHYLNPRCDGCKHCSQSQFYGRTRYDRHCRLHNTAVKTHGACKFWKPRT